MREILFRGKRTDGKGWVYGYLSFIYVNGRNENGLIYADHAKIYDQENCCSHEVFTNTIGQFTGLTDKNGKRIFEGDILNIGKSKEPLIVSFVGFAWQCSTPKHKYFRHRLENCASYKIIGNIHDNPELLP